jgi:hypothetical protein
LYFIFSTFLFCISGFILFYFYFRIFCFVYLDSYFCHLSDLYFIFHMHYYYRSGLRIVIFFCKWYFILENLIPVTTDILIYEIVIDSRMLRYIKLQVNYKHLCFPECLDFQTNNLSCLCLPRRFWNSFNVNTDIIYLSSSCHIQNSATVRHPKVRQA